VGSVRVQKRRWAGFASVFFIVALLFISDLNIWHVVAGVSNLCEHAPVFRFQTFLLSFMVELHS